MNLNSPVSTMQGETRPQDIKVCRCCNSVKDRSEFVKNKSFSSGIDTICLTCSRDKVRLWRKHNPEKRKNQLKKEYGKTYTKNKHLKYTYGITLDEYNTLFSTQQGCCAICGQHQSNFKKALSVDHNHTTGKVRKLLCSTCNFMVGYAKEDTIILQKAIEYLNNHDES